ncbi:MAG: geranylgeranylglycerol-phosphate geranylgeranyltransferase [Ferruginibacter sp.]
MRLILAFFRLVRWPNLVFIVLTQVLFYYAAIDPLRQKGISSTTINSWYFAWLVLASVLIAAAGYIINDYFDRNIDQVNKPGRMVVDKIIKRRWTIIFHIVFSLAGIAIGFYIDFHTKTFWLGMANLLCVLLLFAYSIALKKRLLIGNLLISALTSWVIIVLFLCYYQSFTCAGCLPAELETHSRRLLKIASLYAGFAFVISLIREVVKDMEDMEGDARYDCKTMPIVWGIPVSKMFVAVWIVVLTGGCGVVEFYVLQFGWWWSVLYTVALIIAPLAWVLWHLYKARTATDFHRLSTVIKFIMLTGILSMLLLRFYS